MSTSPFLSALQKLKNTGIAGDQNPYAPSGQDPQPTDGHIETPVDEGIHVDNPYAPQRDPQPTDGMAENSPYAPQKVGKGHALLGALIGGITKNPALAQNLTGYTSPGLEKEELGLQQQQAQTELTRQQGSMVMLPNGTMMPMSLAKAYLPVQAREQGAANVANINVGGRENVAAGQETSKAGIATGEEASKERIAKMNLGPMADVEPELQEQYGVPAQLPLKTYRILKSAANTGLATVQGENGPSIVNKPAAARGIPAGGSSRNLGLGAPAMAGITVVGDQANPGNTVNVKKSQAVGAPGVSSASVVVPRQAEKAEVPTNIGNQKVAFQTAIAHAQLLKQAYQALHNGDTPTLNSIKNAFSSAFGGAGPITYDAIANAYNHEVTSVTSKGHLTNQEVNTGGATMPANASPAQFGGVIDAYQRLMQSKMNMLNQQEQGAVRGSQPHGSTQGNDPLGIR